MKGKRKSKGVRKSEGEKGFRKKNGEMKRGITEVNKNEIQQRDIRVKHYNAMHAYKLNIRILELTILSQIQDT